MRVMTFNILEGGRGYGQQLVSLIQQVAPDIVLLQEVVDPKAVEGWAKELGMNYRIAGGITRLRSAILTTYPVMQWQSHSALPNLKMSRNFIVATLQLPSGQKMQVVSVHLMAHPFILFEQIRLAEIRAVLRYAAPTIPCLIGGDFNAVAPQDEPLSHLLFRKFRAMLYLQGNRYLRQVITAVLKAGFADCYREFHHDPGFTLPPMTPAIRLDYLFANPLLRSRLQTCSVHRSELATTISDHCPVIAEFDL